MPVTSFVGLTRPDGDIIWVRPAEVIAFTSTPGDLETRTIFLSSLEQFRVTETATELLKRLLSSEEAAGIP